MSWQCQANAALFPDKCLIYRQGRTGVCPQFRRLKSLKKPASARHGHSSWIVMKALSPNFEFTLRMFQHKGGDRWSGLTFVPSYTCWFRASSFGHRVHMCSSAPYAQTPVLHSNMGWWKSWSIRTLCYSAAANRLFWTQSGLGISV